MVKKEITWSDQQNRNPYFYFPNILIDVILQCFANKKKLFWKTISSFLQNTTTAEVPENQLNFETILN